MTIILPTTRGGRDASNDACDDDDSVGSNDDEDDVNSKDDNDVCRWDSER